MKLILILVLALSQQDFVCTRAMLVSELQEDIALDGRLKCRRTIPVDASKIETPREKNKRLNAQWDTDCSFEASNDFFKNAMSFFELDSLIDANGE